MVCEICGKDTEDLKKIMVEGTLLFVCSTCIKFGKPVIEQTSKRTTINVGVHSDIKKIDSSANFGGHNIDVLDEAGKIVLTDNYGMIIKKAREKMNLSQEQLGQKINEKKSVIANIENNELEPDTKLIKKLEKILNVKLTEK
ncbi:MAG: multiprotein bridging factor aMBF1 [Candidatus Thermoplasmatota archaeon]|nr:multiprotein bridging factor aMBF1 [Candidatus Thermoplasmatota archaeon]MCL5963719.1 multiprotein bridging factor aMBF1 [Candidatus Thermoplasmatota archaeon]